MKRKLTAPAGQAKIRILMADNHPIVRHGMKAILRPQRDMTIVGEASDGIEALGLIREHLPDVVLLDLRMPRMDGLDVVAEVNASRLSIKVIIMTTFQTELDVCRSMKAGVRGYLPKDSSREEILEAIRHVNSGEIYLPARIAQKVAEGMRNPELSRRERQVLQCVATGTSNKEIGVQLYITEGTVKSHVRSLLEKLGAAGRMSAVRQAWHRGLVRFD
jgi:two-component system NarL family response regulator